MQVNRDIDVFFCVCDEGSFSAAGKKLYMSQSAVSQKIDHLEHNLGVLLFDRHTYRPTLTRAGSYFYEEMVIMKQRFLEIEEHLAAFNHQIVIGITGPFEKKTLPSMITAYNKAYDQNVTFAYYPFGAHRQAIDSHQIDLAFGLMNNFQDDPTLITRVCYQAHVCVLTSQESPYANKQSVEISELAHENIVALGEGAGKSYYHDFLKAFQKDGFIPHIVKFVNTQEDLIMSVRMNEGIAFSAKEVVQDDDQVHILDLKHSMHQAYYGIAYRDHALDPLAAYIVKAYSQL